MPCRAGKTSSNKDGAGETFLAEGIELSETLMHMVFGNQQVVFLLESRVISVMDFIVSATQNIV